MSLLADVMLGYIVTTIQCNMIILSYWARQYWELLYWEMEALVWHAGH